MTLASRDIFTLAPTGQIWVCGACGKTSKTASGMIKKAKTLEDSRGWTDTLPDGARVAAPGWDESCMLNAALCYERQGPEGWKAVE